MTARELPTASATLRKLLDISKRDEWPADELDALEIAIHAIDNVPDLLAALILCKQRISEINGNQDDCVQAAISAIRKYTAEY